MKLFKVNISTLVDAENEQEAIALVDSSIAGKVVSGLSSAVEWSAEHPEGDGFWREHFEIIDATPKTKEEEE